MLMIKKTTIPRELHRHNLINITRELHHGNLINIPVNYVGDKKKLPSQVSYIAII
jgi:hypothetical protein